MTCNAVLDQNNNCGNDEKWSHSVLHFESWVTRMCGKVERSWGTSKRLRKNGQWGRRKPEESVVLSAKWRRCFKEEKMINTVKALVRWKSNTDHWIHWSEWKDHLSVQTPIICVLYHLFLSRATVCILYSVVVTLFLVLVHSSIYFIFLFFSILSCHLLCFSASIYFCVDYNLVFIFLHIFPELFQLSFLLPISKKKTFPELWCLSCALLFYRSNCLINFFHWQ